MTIIYVNGEPVSLTPGAAPAFDLPSGETPPVVDPLFGFPVLMSDVWRRMDDAEADAVAERLNHEPVRLRRIYQTAGGLKSSDPEYTVLHAILREVLDSGRADAILAPSPSVMSSVSSDP